MDIQVQTPGGLNIQKQAFIILMLSTFKTLPLDLKICGKFS